jgi:hypothetical protein
MLQLPQLRDRSFAAKVQALNADHYRVSGLQDIGNVDGDISFWE